MAAPSGGAVAPRPPVGMDKAVNAATSGEGFLSRSRGVRRGGEGSGSESE